MNDTKNNRPGYIMVFALLVIALCMTVAAYIGHRGSTHGPLMNSCREREKAYFLALSGIEIGRSTLAYVDTPDKEKAAQQQSQKDNEKKEASSSAKAFLQRILPVLNRWQQYTLTEEIDGIDGQIDVCLMCEEGKININRVYNFKKEQFRGSKEKGWKDVFLALCQAIEKVNGMSDLFPLFEKTFKERRSKYNDATELLLKKEFAPFKNNLFYEPPFDEPAQKKSKKRPIYLTDIFTVWSSSGKIEPWLFSNSLNIILGLPSVEKNDEKKREESVVAWVKPFKEKVNWQQDWKTTLQPMYGKELQTLPKNIDSMLSDVFDPHFFSIRVHARVGSVVQRVYAILERTRSTAGQNEEYEVRLRKIYWL
jgi:hypothetical protein